MTADAPTFRLVRVAWPRIDLRNTQLENSLPRDTVFQWLTRQTIGFHHEGTSPEVRVIVNLSLDYPRDAVRPIELSLTLFAVFTADENREVSGGEAQRFIESDVTPALWPYLQQKVADLTEESGGPRITLSLMAPRMRRLPPEQQTVMIEVKPPSSATA